MKTQTVAVLAVIGVVTVYAVTRAAVQGIGTAAESVIDYGNGLVTGNNAITSSARSTAYQGAGVLGTLGAATDAVFGGVLSRAGESIGGWVYDKSH